MDKCPIPYDTNADAYFRPWKVVPEFGKEMKNRMQNAPEWTNKANDNKDFLEKVFAKTGAKTSPGKLTKTLWSSTYIYSAHECEEFWPNEVAGERKVISHMLTDAEWEEITKLACWVWEERFVRSGFLVQMGGRLVSEMLSVRIFLFYK